MLMCMPKFYELKYEINPWMDLKKPILNEQAQAQWQKLYQLIGQCRCSVDLLEPKGGLPDLVFTANAGLAKEKQVYLSRFKHRERQPERNQFETWFRHAGYQIIPEPKEFLSPQGIYIGPNLEGAGDALFLDSTLFAGYGFRTDREIYPYLFELLNISEKVYCELVDPNFYHLDTCFCPLNESQALWHPPAFSTESRQKMKKKADLFAIPAEEENQFACNAIVIEKNIIIPEGCPRTTEILDKLGFTVYSCPMSEFIKSGGACKCLTFV